MLNRVLPRDIRALAWAPVDDAFSARFSCAHRAYRYFFARRGRDLGAMRRAAAALVGRHDFRNLCKMDPLNVSHFVRVVYSARVYALGGAAARAAVGLRDDAWGRDAGGRAATAADEGGDGGDGGDGDDGDEAEHRVCCFEICGQAFLWHMVRCIAAVLLLVGEGREPPELLARLLASEPAPAPLAADAADAADAAAAAAAAAGDEAAAPAPAPAEAAGDRRMLVARKPHYEMAREDGLVLHHCGFRGLSFAARHEPGVLWRAHEVLEEQWERAALAAARLRHALDELGAARVRAGDARALAAQLARAEGGAPGGRRRKRSPPAAGADGAAGGDGGDGGDDDAASGVARGADDGETVPWASVLRDLRRARAAARPHKPLLARPGSKTYDERVADLAPRKRERLARQQLSHGGAAGAAADAEFFRDKRARGEADGAVNL